MGLFKNLFNSDEMKNASQQSTPVPQADIHSTSLPNGGLNLTKGNILDLTKQEPTLENIRVAAGWDMVKKGNDYDLDLCALLLDKHGHLTKSCNACVYFGKKKSKGIFLDKDNLTGEGDGDDENIFVSLSKIPKDVKKIVFAVVIYNPTRFQGFSGVKNAFVRLVNTDERDKEICRYDLTEDGGKNTAVIFAELYREEGNWKFKAVGELCKASISELKNKYS